MGLTGVIYAAIVVAWAAFLVPLALRKHDLTSRSHSVERFSSAMRVLSRSGSSASGRVVVTPPRDTARVVGPLKAEPTAPAETAPRPSRRAIQRAAARRRRVVRILVALTLVVAAVSLTAVIPAWSAAVPIALLVFFLIVARRHVRRVNRALLQPVVEVTPEARPVVATGAVRVDVTHGAARSDEESAPDQADSEPTVQIAVRPADTVSAGIKQDEPNVAVASPAPTKHFGGWASGTGASVAAPAATASPALHSPAGEPIVAEGASLWDPLPITLPTYVSKATAAPRTVRSIQLGESGTWSSGHSQTDSATVAKAASETAGDGTDTDGEESRAVNG